MKNLLYILDNSINIKGKLKEKIGSPHRLITKKQLVGIIFNFEDDIYLKNITKKNKNSIINSSAFIKNIKSFAFIVFLNNNKCEIICNNCVYEDIKYVLEDIPKTYKQIISMDINSKNLYNILIENYKHKFNNPYICKVSPISGYNFKNYGISLIKTKSLEKMDKNIIDNLISQIKTTNCSLNFVIDYNTINYMRKLCFSGFTKNKNNTITQKEIAGNLFINYKNIIPSLELKESSLKVGQEQEIEINSTLYNFHSHPKEAYIKNNVRFAWPSAQDYNGFFSSVKEDNSILHIVLTLEGIYIISISKESLDSIDKIDVDDVSNFIENNLYYFEEINNKSIQWYINIVNNIKYKRKTLFKVEYTEWDNIHNKIFNISSKKYVDNCFVVDKNMKLFSKLIDL